MRELKNVSFDFDGTLTRSDVQSVAKACIAEGHNVFVTTARWPDPMIFRWTPSPTNEDMYEILDAVGIPRTNVIFTNAGTKADFLVQAKTDIHLDDNRDQLFWAGLAGIKCIDVLEKNWEEFFLEKLKAPKYNIKLLICGEGRHGKDTVAEMLCNNLGLQATSSSWVAASLFFDKYKDTFGYETLTECYEDRVNKRKEWYDFISEYNNPDRTKLTKKILETSNIYVGLRNPEEFHAARHLFDATIYVDASDRLPGEGKESNGITKDMCDIVIENNKSLKELRTKVEALGKILKLDTTAKTIAKIF